MTSSRPSAQELIDWLGYEPKQLYHIMRLSEFGKNYMNNIDYEQCLKAQNKEELINIKKRK